MLASSLWRRAGRGAGANIALRTDVAISCQCSAFKGGVWWPRRVCGSCTNSLDGPRPERGCGVQFPRVNRSRGTVRDPPAFSKFRQTLLAPGPDRLVHHECDPWCSRAPGRGAPGGFRSRVRAAGYAALPCGAAAFVGLGLGQVGIGVCGTGISAGLYGKLVGASDSQLNLHAEAGFGAQKHAG